MKPKFLKSLFGICVLVALTCRVAHAHPYASGITNNNGTIQFILNEGGATVYVVYDDNTTNSLGVLTRGGHSFPLSGHTGFAIYVRKEGNGVPSLISTDSDQYAIYANPRGVAVNKNPKSPAFGRIYTGSGGTGGFVFGTPGFKPQGLYALNADYTDALGRGTNAFAQATFAASGLNGPWRMRVAPDDTLLVDDFSTAAAALWQFKPDLSDSNLVLAIIGQTAAAAAGIHGDFFGTPLMTGSLAEGNLVLWTADSGMAVPNETIAPNLVLGPNTSRGDFNCVFRYDIGSGPLPWNQPPNYAYTVGLSGIAGLRTEVEIGKDGKIIAAFGRANLSNPNIQILDPTGTTQLYNSWLTTGGADDPWAGAKGSGSRGGTYAGVRVSPDGRFLASVDINNGVTLAFLTNGIPDDGSIFGIQNTPATGNSRGMDWDAANNLYVISSGQGLLRTYSLGITTTCVTSNDFTGTNGTFQLILPSVTASLTTTTPNASQNYINNGGTPIPGVFNISLNQSTLEAPVVVNFTRGGTAALTNNYNFNYGTNADGVVISANTIIFPAGSYPHAGNWSVDLQVIPTATPVSTNTLTAIVTLTGGSSYQAVAPVQGTVFIQNTGPQLLLLTAAPSGTTMYRGVTNDYAKFIITRLGDTNGPGNTAGNVSPVSYTITNVSYFGTANFPGDYTARAQRLDPAGDGLLVPPVDGPTAIVIKPGDTTVTCVIGNPVRHANLSLPPTNLTVIVNLTNAVTGINNTSQEGFPYTVGTVTTTLSIIDNAVGPEIVLWSNPLTNAADSSNWTLTYAAVNFGNNPMLPAIFPNYDNTNPGGATNDFSVIFGHPIAADFVEPSPVMAANGWDKALRMTVNKLSASQGGVNVYPQGTKFGGNYALRFNMYLSLYQFAIDNPGIGVNAREYALFGVNHHGTNTNWKTDAPIAAGAGNSTTNADGVWFAINAGSGGITPADFDAFRSPPLPNAGSVDLVSATAASQNGVFKHPPFAAMNVLTPTVANPGGGEPINKWVDVSVEITRQTNVSLFINRSKVLADFAITNNPLSATYSNGSIMLGYNDPNAGISDNTAFVLFSNVRVIELSPYIMAHPVSMIATQGQDVTITSSAAYGSSPITNTWWEGAAAPTALVQTDTASATNLTSALSLVNVQRGTNYFSVFSDPAGSITGLVASLEVILGPTNKTANIGETVQFQVTPSGPSAPTSYQWKFNGNNLPNNTHYAGVTTATLTITNVQPGDDGTYSVAVVNPAGTVTPAAILTLAVSSQPTFSHVDLVDTNAVLSFSTPNLGDTTSSFTLQSSAFVQGPYTNTPATFTGANGTFQVTVPQTGGNMFYRLLHN